MAPVRALLSTIGSSARVLWDRARNERASPREIGWAFGMGVFIGFSPFVGVHLGMAFLVATVLRLNRLWTMAGSRVSITPLLITVAFLEVEAAHRLRTHEWVTVTPHEVLGHGREFLVDWCLGACLVATPIAAVAGLVAYVLARRRASQVTGRTPDGPRRPSSESPRSAPPAPSS
jgi:uncharacterized protein (DUF2062 family)